MKNIVQDFLTKMQKQKNQILPRELVPLDYQMPINNNVSQKDTQHLKNVNDFYDMINRGAFLIKDDGHDVEAMRSPYEFYSRFTYWNKYEAKIIKEAAKFNDYTIFIKGYDQFKNEQQFDKALMTEIYTNALLFATDCPLDKENEVKDSVREIAFNFLERNIRTFTDAIVEADKRMSEILPNIDRNPDLPEEDFDYEIHA